MEESKIEQKAFSDHPNHSHYRDNDSSEIVSIHSNSNQGESYLRCFVDSFKPISLEIEGIDVSELTQIERSNIATARHPLAKRLKSRHLQMIAIGGSIGTGLFVGSGYALSQGGPGAMLIGYSLVGYSLLCVINALGEMSVQFPVSGSFNAFFSRFVDPTWGFVLGLLYALSWLISFPSELIAASLTLRYWNTSVDGAVWIAIFWLVITIINFFGVVGYGEVEFVLSILKVLAVIGFIIVGICITCGVGDQGYLGGRYWHNPGAFNNGFKGVASVFVSAAFSFGGIELVALAAAETANPQKSLPRATKQVFWRITLFYILTAIIIGCLVPYTNENLISSDDADSQIAQSPFVIAIEIAGIKVLPDILNAVVLIAVISVGNSAVYGCSRSLASLAVQGLIPEIFGYVDRAGRPLVSIVVSCLFGLLGFLVDAAQEETVFTWFFSICSLSSFFTWAAICFTHLRWRWALQKQGRSKDQIIFQSPLGVFGSISGIIVLLFIVALEMWVSLYPTWGEPGVAQNVNFWQSCLSLPLMIVMYIVHKTYRRSWNMIMIKLEDIDLDTGRREIDDSMMKIEIDEIRVNEIHKPNIFYRLFGF